MAAWLIPELSVTDWRASLRFYEDMLGFTCAYDRPDEGFAFLTLGEVSLMIDQMDLGRSFDTALTATDRPFGRGINLQIQVTDLSPILARLTEANWPLVLPLEDRWYRRGILETGNRQIVVADPDGYLLRFFQDLGQRPAR